MSIELTESYFKPKFDFGILHFYTSLFKGEIMDREELTAAINSGPTRIYMNDKREYEIAVREEALITDIAAHILYRSKTDGKL